MTGKTTDKAQALRRDALHLESMTRSMPLELRAQAEGGPIVASLSSDVPVRREGYDGPFDEVLSHADGAIDLSRAEHGLPLLWGHDHNQQIGVVRGLKTEGGRLRGELTFGNSARAREIEADVRDGIISNISIGYRVTAHDWHEPGQDERAAGAVDTLTATRWQIFEASVVSVPADHTVGVNRSKTDEVTTMNEKDKRPDADATGEATPVADITKRHLQAVEAGKKAERARVAALDDLFAVYEDHEGVRDLKSHCVREGLTEAQATRLLLDLVGQGAAPIARDYKQSESRAPRSARIEAGEDGVERGLRGIEDAIQHRAGNVKDAEKAAAIEGAGYRGLSLAELAREFVRQVEPSAAGGSRQDVIARAFTLRAPIAHGTASFGNLLENVARKSMLRGYEEAEEVWDRVCRIIEVPDFKQMSLLKMSGMTGLTEVPASGEIEGVTAADYKETIQLKTYAGRFDINRQAIINDDMNALSRIPAAMGQAASRNVGDVVFTDTLVEGDVLTLKDGTAVLAAGRNNLVDSGSGAAPSTATLDAARVAMAKQKDPKTQKPLNIRWSQQNPARIVVPVALETATEVVATSPNYPEIDYSGASQNTNNVSPFRNRIEVVADARLDADVATRWYALADPNAYDNLVVAFLAGQRLPTVEMTNPWDSLGASYRVYHDVAAAWVGFEAAYSNYGA